MKNIFYYLTKFFFLFLLKIYNRIEINGKENLLPDEKVIVIANHSSNLDPVVVGSVFPGRLRYLAKSELFVNPLLGFLIRALGAIPVSKVSNQSAGASLRAFLELLDGGEKVLLFPEGSRSQDGRVSELQGGAALLAEKTRVPVQPVYISGTWNAMPSGSSKIRPSKIKVSFGKPIYPDELAEGLSKKEARAAISSAMENSLREMERLEYSDGCYEKI